MKLYLLAGTVAAIGLAAPAAHATVYFNSTTVSGAVSSSNGVPNADGLPDSVTFSAASFTASTPNFTQISLELSAATPSDGGSTMVYLVGDNGSGGATGTAGSPKSVATGVLIDTISDSSLSSSPSLFTISVSTSTDSSITTLDKEYWVELVYTSGSTLWWYGPSATGGIGLTGQDADDSYTGITPDSDGTYDLIVSTPEPTTLAILGGALAGLGYVRRRSPKAI